MTTVEEIANDPLFLTLSILINASAGLFCAFDARRRGRSVPLWFAIGFLFGLIGVVAWFVARDWRGRATNASPADRCPACGFAGPATYGFCTKCGAERGRLDALAGAPTGAPSLVLRQTGAAASGLSATCSRCGKPYMPRKTGSSARCPTCELTGR